MLGISSGLTSEQCDCCGTTIDEFPLIRLNARIRVPTRLLMAPSSHAFSRPARPWKNSTPGTAPPATNCRCWKLHTACSAQRRGMRVHESSHASFLAAVDCTPGGVGFVFYNGTWLSMP